MNKINIYRFILVVFLLSACKDTQENANIQALQENPMSILGEETDADARIIIMGNDRAEDADFMNKISCTGIFKNGTNRVMVNSVKLGNYKFPAILAETMYYDQLLLNRPKFADLADRFGKITKLEVNGGTEFPSFSKDIRLPEKMGIVNLPQTISKSNGVTINFTPENSDEDCTNVVIVDYNGSVSKSLHPNMPDRGANMLKYDTDMGIDHIDFSDSDLAEIPLHATVNIILIRLVKEYIYVADKRIEVLKITYQYSASAEMVQ